MAKKAARRSKAAAKEGVNKAQEIRNTFTSMGWQARSRDVIKALADRGISVSSAQVSNVRTAHQKRQEASAAKAAAVPAAAAAADFERALLSAKELVQRAGGMADARKMLDLLQKLR